MASGFKAKDLHYEKQEPAFLRKLRGEHVSDRSNVQIARPKKDRLKTGDDDDGPTIVDETGESVSKEDYEAMTKPKAADDEVVRVKEGEVAIQPQQGVNGSVENLEQREKQKVAEVGAPKKRKAVRVVGEDVEDIDVVSVQKIGATGAAKEEDGSDALSAKATTTKKKGKKVKLSFDDPEG